MAHDKQDILYGLSPFVTGKSLLFSSAIFKQLCIVARGVLQTLVEKHFPAPDRNRIHRLLGLEPPRKSDSKMNNNGDADPEAGGSSGKRKPGKGTYMQVT
jgi:hypothetical protein